MKTLIAIAISVAYFYSSAVVFGLSGEVFFWELVTLIDVMLLGHWLEMRSIMGASRVLEELVKIMPSVAHLKKNDKIVDVGIAIGTSTDVAIETADIVMVKSDPRDVVDIIGLSRETHSKMFQNFLWATGYNIFAIPLADGIISGYGILLSPAVGEVLMSLST